MLRQQAVHVAFVTFLAYACTVGITQYAFGVFVTPIEDDLGWTRAEITIALSFFAASGIAGLPLGWALDRFGSRSVMAVSILALGLSQLLRWWMTDLWQFYALSALQFSALPGAVLLPAGRLVGAWFTENRGRAMGLTAMGANVGGVVFASLTSGLVDLAGWRATYVVYGCIFFALVPLVLLIVRDPAAPPPAAAGRTNAPPGGLGLSASEAMRTRAFYLVVLALLLAQLTYQSVLPQIVPHLEAVGISRGRAALALSGVALFGAMGKVLFGWLTDRYPARFALTASLGCQVTGIAILLATDATPLYWLFVPVFGLGFGALGALMPLLVQHTFGLRAFGTILGMINFITLGAAVGGPALVGASFEATGSYQVAFTTLAVLFVVAAVVVSFARPPAALSRPAPEPAQTAA